jgi:hypothetical protein
MNVIVHQLADCLRFIGMRDRLRCPMCSAVGTYKPHGGWFDSSDKRKVRRWMCKWCGFYRGPEPLTRVVPSRVAGCWVLLADEPNGNTPQEIVEGHYGAGRVWPWRG